MLIKITNIVPSPFQKRTEFTNIESLAADIKAQGLLSPIIVRRTLDDPENKYELIAGERRLRAYRLLAIDNGNYSEIEAVVRKDCSDDEAQSIHLSENLQREGISPLEEAAELAQLLEHCTLKQAAEYLGRSAGWIAKRANLAKLCPKFMAAYAKNDKIKLWPIEALELVARMPAKVQEDILSRNDRHVPTVKELAKEIAGRIMKLSSATWPKDDCQKCQKRTAAAPDLFAEISVEKDDRCLDAKCLGEHTEAALKAKMTELKKGWEKFFTVEGDYNEFDPIPRNSELKNGALSRWQIKKVKAGTKGAVPALVVGGAGIGETIYIKPNEDYTDRSAAPKAPKSMKEKRAGLEKRRVVKYIGMLIAIIEKMVKEKIEFPYKTIVPLVSLFGAKTLKGEESRYASSPWKKVCEASPIELFAFIAPCIIYHLQTQISCGNPNKKEVDMLSEYLGIQCDRVYADAVAEIPEPKSWAKDPPEPKTEKPEKRKSTKKENKQ